MCKAILPSFCCYEQYKPNVFLIEITKIMPEKITNAREITKIMPEMPDF